MEWLKDIIIPLIKVIFIFGIVGYVLSILLRAFFKIYNKKLKFILKYKILRKPFNEQYVKWSVKSIDKGMKKNEVKTYLLTKGVSIERVQEVMFIYDEVFIEMKGGNVLNGKYKRSNTKDEGKLFEE